MDGMAISLLRSSMYYLSLSGDSEMKWLQSYYLINPIHVGILKLQVKNSFDMPEPVIAQVNSNYRLMKLYTRLSPTTISIAHYG